VKTQSNGKIGVLVEEHFDETEYHRFNEFFPANGYDVEYLSYLWNQPSLTFKGNDHTAEITVTVDVTQVNLDDYQGIILIGGYAMDRLRYQVTTKPGQINRSPSVEFLRKAVEEMDRDRLKIGTICHSLWLFCADTTLLKNRKVTCAHNIICDVENAGGVVIYDGEETAETYVDRNLISGRHPGVVEAFMQVFLQQLKKMPVIS
jgi:putative intracellular protease/amidase